MEKLISLIEAASLAGLKDADTLRTMIRQGRGPATVIVGKRQKIREADWQTWLDTLPPPPKARATA